ncbi:MAG TPA: putative quinol monooxygenase [Alicycliphilus sp.]|nr:putative quinol monooxygenase [Alicycliphilus sp.]
MTIIISVKYRLKPGKRDELLSFVSDNVLNTRKETGNLAYTHYPSLENEDEMFVFEMWEDIESLYRHIQAPHYVAFSKRRRPILQSYESRTYDAQLRSERHTAPEPQ